MKHTCFKFQQFQLYLSRPGLVIGNGLADFLCTAVAVGLRKVVNMEGETLQKLGPEAEKLHIHGTYCDNQLGKREFKGTPILHESKYHTCSS